MLTITDIVYLCMKSHFVAYTGPPAKPAGSINIVDLFPKVFPVWKIKLSFPLALLGRYVGAFRARPCYDSGRSTS